MKNAILIPSIALVLGGAAGFLLSKVLLEKKYVQLAEEQIQKDITSVKERLEDKCAKCTFKKQRISASDDTNDVKGSTDSAVAGVNPASNLGARSNGYEEAKRNYNLGGALARSQNRHEPADTSFEDDETDENERDGEMLRMEETGNLEPYLITDIEFSEGCTHYDKLTCYYYADDDTMTDEHERLLFEDDRDKTLGVMNVIDGFKAPDTKTIWIRNERLGADYEVILINGSYNELVSGAKLSPRERQEARMKRKDARPRED